jgi:hypothetical protein
MRETFEQRRTKTAPISRCPPTKDGYPPLVHASPAGELNLSRPATWQSLVGDEPWPARRLRFIANLGISLPCQVIAANLLVACALAYRS